MVLKNFAAMSTLSIFRSAVQLGINVLLAFFIDPSQYGLVAFSVPFVTLVTMLTDLGMSSALVRMEDVDKKTFGAALTLLIAVGGTLAALLIAGAPFLAAHVHMPGLPGVLSGMAISTVFAIAAIAPRAVLERGLAYGRIASTESSAVAISAIVAVALAAAGAGVWALVAFSLLNNAIRTLVFCILAAGQMTLSFEWGRCRGILSFGTWVLLTNLLTFLARNFDNLLIGTVLGAASVGLYGLAYQFMLIPLIAVTWPASGVLMATLSRGGYDKPQSDAIILATIGITAAISFPMMICLSLIFPDLAQGLLSHKWQGIGEILRWLAPLGALQSISSYNGAVLLVAGRARAQFLYSVLNTVATMLVCLIAIQWGLMSMVRALVVSGAVLSLGLTVLIVRVARLQWQSLGAALLPGLSASAVAIVVTILWHLSGVRFHGDYLALAACLLVATLLTDALFLGRLKGWLTALKSRTTAQPVVTP